MDCPNDRYVNDEAICQAVVAMLARIGIKVNLLAQTRAKFFAKINCPAYDTRFYMLGWTPATYDAHNMLVSLLAHARPRAAAPVSQYRRLFQQDARRAHRQDPGRDRPGEARRR